MLERNGGMLFLFCAMCTTPGLTEQTAYNHDSLSLVLVLQYRLVHQSRPKPINPNDEARTHQLCTQVLRGILMRLLECGRLLDWRFACFGRHGSIETATFSFC